MKIWMDITRNVVTSKRHQDHFFVKSVTESLPSYFEERVGFLKKNLKKHWCYELPDGKSIHVKEYSSYYLVHWDSIDPNRKPLQHLIVDAPKETVLGLFLADQLFNKGKGTNWVLNKISNFLNI